MTDDGPRRRYTEEEFALILQKASEMQVPREGKAPSRFPGLTLEEMRSIASEAGIDPEAVTRAASLLGTLEWDEKTGSAATIFGGPSKYHLDCEIPGRLPPEELGRVLAEVRRIWEHQGEVTEELGGFQWRTVGQLSALTVNITPRGDSTAIQIVGDRGPSGALTFVFPMMVSGILVGALGAAFEPTSAAGIISLITGTLGAGFLTARTLWTSGTRRFKKRLSGLVDTLSASVEKVALPPRSGRQTD